MDRSFVSLGLLLVVASCVPPAAARYQPQTFATAELRQASLPTNEALRLPTAAEAPPPPEILAEEIAPGLPAQPFTMAQRSNVDMNNALECLTTAIYYEARSESDDGERAVAQVVLNRVRHPAFPKSVCGVVYQGSNRTTGCQFSFTCDGSLARGREPAAWDRAARIAADALSGYVFAPVGTATHFHTTAIHPWWADSMAKAVTIGAHIFYRWRGEWGDPTSFRRPYVGNEVLTASVTPESQDAIAQPPSERTEIIEGVTIHRSADRGTRYASAEDGTMVRIHRLNGSGSQGSASEVKVHRGVADSQLAQSPSPEPVAAEAGAILASR
jgi:spore germination cell wall hydrolase CwlJ-like protein